MRRVKGEEYKFYLVWGNKVRSVDILPQIKLRVTGLVCTR